MKKKTRKCDDYSHGHWNPVNGTLICAKGHKPRFYKPLYVGDDNWGWKRRCENYQAKT
jgi:hypothetical protein